MIANPGVPCDESYFAQSVSNVTCVFVNHQGFEQFELPATLRAYDPSRFAAMPYNIPNVETMRSSRQGRDHQANRLSLYLRRETAKPVGLAARLLGGGGRRDIPRPIGAGSRLSIRRFPGVDAGPSRGAVSPRSMVMRRYRHRGPQVRARARSWPRSWLRCTPGGRSPHCDRLGPAYFYPSGAGLDCWNRLASDAGSIKIEAILNPASGPGTAQDPNYVAVVNQLRAAGGSVFGYVSTRYGDRDMTAVIKDIDKYLLCYNINGVFVDEMANTQHDFLITRTLPVYQKSLL